tara:strand:- start:2230 stop:2439 length:210 start_codon:yes stop_codon:yes gene_type:complete
MPDIYDMELDARPDESEYAEVKVEYDSEGNCASCKGYGVQFYAYNVYDLEGNVKQEVEEEPCDKCGGRI